MRFWRREKGIDRILESWAQPSDEFVRRVVGGIESQPRRSYRLALTGALTAAALTLFGAFGGISYAAKAVQQAVNIVQAPTHTSRSVQPRTHVQKSSSVKNPNARANTAAKHTGSSTPSTVGTSNTPGLSRSSSSDQYEGKTTICQRTDSARNPWVLVTVDNQSLPAHKAHGDTLPGPNGSCPGPPIP